MRKAKKKSSRYTPPKAKVARAMAAGAVLPLGLALTHPVRVPYEPPDTGVEAGPFAGPFGPWGPAVSGTGTGASVTSTGAGQFGS
jgi:hypothetical protein